MAQADAYDTMDGGSRWAGRGSCAPAWHALGCAAIAAQIIRPEHPIQAACRAAAKLALRPAELKVEPLRAAGVNHLTAVVASVTFLGALARVQAARAGLAGGPTLAVDLFNDHQLALPTAGEPVKLIFPLHACWVSETAGA